MASARWTERAEGDVRSRDDVIGARQVHGNSVVVVTDPKDSGQEADALVTVSEGVTVMVRTADCAPIALASEEGCVAVAHGGWRGLMAGIAQATATTMRDLGARQIQAGLGPCIHPCCYEFGSEELQELARALGPTVVGETRDGRPALDLPAAVRVALERAGAELVFEANLCTGCEAERFWSHRTRGEAERQGVLAWLT